MEVRKVCLFCKLDEDNELLYGKIYELDDEIVAHHFCLLLSSNMEQNGEDSEGIQGFLKEDILKEYKRGRRITCCYCKRSGATVGCCRSRCKKVFHLPCGRREGSLHQFSDEFKSYCAAHRPLQVISPDALMEASAKTPTCGICQDDIQHNDFLSTLWAPCCKKAWFHRDCVQRLALSFGYFFKCPLCNNKKVFRDAMSHFGIYVPEQDASWELEPDAFQDLLHRHDSCNADHCLCPQGRSHVMVGTRWELVLCKYCGAQGIHVGCGKLKWTNPEWECSGCTQMLQRAQEGGDTNSEEEPEPSPATANRIPTKRKKRYFKGSGGSRRTKCRKRSVRSSSQPYPSSSQSPVMPEGGPSAVTDGPVSPSTSNPVIELSDDDDDDEPEEEVIEVSDGDDDGGDDLPGKTIVCCGGKAIRVVPIATIAATDDRQNILVVGDVDVKLPSHLYDVQQDAKPAASNSRISHILGTMVPCSSVDNSSSSMSLHPSVYGSSPSTSLRSSVDGNSSSMPLHSCATSSHSQPSVSGTARGSLLQSYLMSENLQLESASQDQVPSVAHQMGNKTPAGTESQNPNTSSVRRSASRTSSPSTAVLPPSRVRNRPHRDRCNQQHGSSVNTPSQQEPRVPGDRLTGHHVEDTLGYFIISNPNKMQVDGVNLNVVTVYLPLTPFRKLFRNHVIETAPALSEDVIASIIDSIILNSQAPYLKKPEQSILCSGQERGVGESYPEKWVDDSCSEKEVEYLEGGVSDSCSERRLSGDTYSEGGLLGLGDCNAYSEKKLLETDVGDTYSVGELSETQVCDSYSESGISDTCSDIEVKDFRREGQFNWHLPLTSYSIVTRSRSRCLLNSTTPMTRSLTRKMQESMSPSCKCESCKEMLGKKDQKVHKDSSSNFSLGEVVRRRRRSGSSSRGIPRTRRSRSLSLSRNSKEDHYSQNTFSHAEIGVCSYSECDSFSERGQSDTCSVTGLSDTYSEIRVDYSQTEGQYDCHLPVTSYSPIVTYSNSRYVLNGVTHPTRSLTKKMLQKKDWQIDEDSISSSSLGEEVRGRRSGRRSRGLPRRRRRRRRRSSRSLSLSRNTRKHRSNQNTCSLTETSYSGYDSNSEKGLSDTSSVMGLSDNYSDIGVEYSQTGRQFNCHSPVRAYSIVTRSRSRCILNNTRYMTRSLTKKLQEGRFPSCGCETCREATAMLIKDDWKVHKNSEVNLNRSVRRRERGSRRRCRSVNSCGETQYTNRSRRDNWRKSTILRRSIQSSDGSIGLMNQFTPSMQVTNESGMEQVYVTQEIDILNNGMCELNVIGESQSGVLFNTGIGVREVSSSNVSQHHNSENMKKHICCINMGTGVAGAAFCGCMNGVSKREESLRVREIFSVPHSGRRMEDLEDSYGLHATEMVSGSLTD